MQQPEKKLLITGASGFLGWNLIQIAARQWRIYGTYHSNILDMSYASLSKVDLTDFAQLKQYVQAVQPDAVIHLAALSSPNQCQTEPDLSYQMNVQVSANLAGLCADADIPCVFTSTDLVFDGLHPPYRETDPVSPVNRYGEHKAIAETEMLQRYPQTAVCRMPLMFGATPPTASSFIQPFIRQLRAGQALKLFVDEVRTPVSATTAAQGLLLALETVQGRIHLGGRERISRYDFGCLMAEVLDLPSSGLAPCSQQDVPMAAPRSPDVSLDSTTAFRLGYTPLLLRHELAALKGQI